MDDGAEVDVGCSTWYDLSLISEIRLTIVI